MTISPTTVFIRTVRGKMGTLCKDMDREVRSFKKTLKQFSKIAGTIPNTPIASKSGRRMRRVVLMVFAGLLLLMVFIPPFRFPIDGKITSGFFLRQKPESGFILDIETHKGLDIAASTGTRVIASAPGIVTEAGYSESFGNYVKVTHMFGLSTYYAHLSEITAKRGRLILLRALRPIGKVGSTGRSTGPHLHFEMKLFGFSLPPRFLLIFHGIRKAVIGL